MTRQYDILSKCLKELSKSRLQPRAKLMLELLLLQTKQVLLDEKFDSLVAGEAASERTFQGLYDHVRRVCHCTGAELETRTLISNLEQLMVDLKKNGSSTN